MFRRTIVYNFRNGIGYLASIFGIELMVRRSDMRQQMAGKLRLNLFILLFTAIILPLSANLLPSSAQNTGLVIVGPNNESTPVVNENNQLQLRVVEGGQPVGGVTFESGSPEIATVNPQNGMVSGIRRGYATITARRDGQTISAFVVVAGVSGGTTQILGDLSGVSMDRSKALYISDPLNHVIFKKDGLVAAATVFAGKNRKPGNKIGIRSKSLFRSPTAVSVDNDPRGGIYIADTLNHSIKKIGFNDQVMTVLGTGSPGRITADRVPLNQPSDVSFSSPIGMVSDVGGNLYIADTDNNAVYFADFVRKEMRLLAGEPGAIGNNDGKGRAARFNHPEGIAISNDGRSLAVADQGNNRVRLITIPNGDVSTIRRANNLNGISLETFQQTGDEISFNSPQSVSFDAIGNLYVVDKNGASVVTVKQELVSLAQAGTFGKAVSVMVNGTDTVVLDANPQNGSPSIKTISVGAPEILNLSQKSDRLEGGTTITITGRNFAPESQVLLGEKIISATVESATRISFIVPLLDAPGKRTLSVRTRGGLAQTDFLIRSKSVQELGNGEITTIVGGVPFLGDGGAAAPSTFRRPFRLALDGAGNLFIADSFNNRIRRIDAETGIITTVAGNGTKNFRGDGGPALAASLGSPSGVAIDRLGNILIADINNSRVRLVDSVTGIITTIAGNGNQLFGGDGGPAINAGLTPFGIAVDVTGNIFIADFLNSRIRRVDRSGIITTVAGNGNIGFSGDGGPATSANLTGPSDVALDAAGNIFIADAGNHRVRRVDIRTGIITTIAGSGIQGFSGDGGRATGANLSAPFGISIDGAGNLFIADTGNSRVRRVDARTGIITTFAGSGIIDFSGDGGPATFAGLAGLAGLTVDGLGNLFIVDTLNNRIRRVDARAGTINTMAGNGIDPVGDNGPALEAGLFSPRGITLDRNGNIFVADALNNRVRRIEATSNIITTVAGGAKIGTDMNNVPATETVIISPQNVAVDNQGNLFIADALTNRIRRVDGRTSIITTVAGTGNSGFSGDGGPAVNASLMLSVFSLVGNCGLAVDDAGNIFFTDTFNNRVRRVDVRTGIITTVVGNGNAGFSGDGGLATNASISIADIFVSGGIALDRLGNLFIADTNNHRIRRIDGRTGIITTVVGNGTPGFSGDGGPAINAALLRPITITLDRAGNLFLVDVNNVVRRVEAISGRITTIAGNQTVGFNGDGRPATQASLRFPYGLAIDGAGNLLISDSDNDVIRLVKGVAEGNQPGSFEIDIDPNNATVEPGGSTSFLVSVRAVGAFFQPVNLSAALNPPNSNINISLSANSITPGGSAILSVRTTTLTPSTSFSINITGVAGQVVRNRSVTLNVLSVGTEELKTDDGTVESGAIVDGLIIVNRLTPSSYPATLQRIRIRFDEFQGVPSPVGQTIRLLVFTNPSGGGRPQNSPIILVDQLVTIPRVREFVDFEVNGPTINSGDFYVGYQAPSPSRGVGFSADINGLQQQRAFASTDLRSFDGPVRFNDGTPANFLIRAVIRRASR
jgi:DNA-binding beta-propeller fold protein YncE